MSGNVQSMAESSTTPSNGMSQNPPISDNAGHLQSASSSSPYNDNHHEDDNTQQSGLDLAVAVVLTSCDAFVDDYHCQKITKASALLGIQSILVKAVDSNDKELSEAFS
jgi:hypothetical protein